MYSCDNFITKRNSETSWPSSYQEKDTKYLNSRHLRGGSASGCDDEGMQNAQYATSALQTSLECLKITWKVFDIQSTKEEILVAGGIHLLTGFRVLGEIS
ncbi:hypothetical protein MKX03_017200 [Papaver bracteatum]|nr:hypothetical protein MKX03_017200 [Papaver bracteatum]